MTGKTIYYAHGSGDGVLGVFTNVKKAYGIAKLYGATKVSYAQACKALKAGDVLDLGNGATISPLTLNLDVYTGKTV